jgi:hypothetical protein
MGKISWRQSPCKGCNDIFLCTDIFPFLQDGNDELQKQLDRELQVQLRTGQHASSALAGVKVNAMKHVHKDQAKHEEGAGHQM